ncbi:MAG TPA: metal-sensing transcriptional repressor, partial [Candidatus Dojkabacteria bacterium]|nr:metal-sensing transcriptional repressor [Candidatus Dojkabacteria bacterium]
MAKKGPSSIQDRLHRIEGQVRGIEKLIEQNAEAEKIIMQLDAVISSLESTKLELIKAEIKKSLLAKI